MKEYSNPALRATSAEAYGPGSSYGRPDARTESALLERTMGRIKPDEHLVSLLSPATMEAEQYRTLGLMLEQRRQTGLLQVIGISSPTVGDGKTMTSINLAGALGQSPTARVLLIDADFRKPSVPGQLGLRDSNALGFRDAILNSTLKLKDIVRRTPAWNLSLVTVGRAQIMPHEIFKSARFVELLDEARSDYEWIILDTSPLVLTPDCLMMARHVDGFVMVVRAHQTSRKEVGEALNALGPSKLIGLVFNSDDHYLSAYKYGPYYLSAEVA